MGASSEIPVDYNFTGTYTFTTVVKLPKSVKTMTSLEHEIPEWFARLAGRTAAFRVARQTQLADDGSEKFGWRFELQPTGARTTIKVLIEAKQRLTPREFLSFVHRCSPAASKETLVVCSPTISPRVAELCRDQGVGYLDAAGNCHVHAPGLFIHIEGQSNPHRTRRKAIDPFATKSSRIARLLLSDVRRGWQVQELAGEAEVSLGLASRVKTALLDEAFVELRRGLLFVREPQALLRAWRNAYKLPERQAFYVMDKTENVERRIGNWATEHGLRYALTAFSGAWRLAPMVRHGMSTVYVAARNQAVVAGLIAELDAKQVDSGANLSIWLPHDPFTFHGARPIKGLTTVSALQLYLDLGQLSGRGKEAADEVLEKELQPKWQA